MDWEYEYYGVNEPSFVVQSNYVNSQRTVYYGSSCRLNRMVHDVGVWKVKYSYTENF